jgi:hypothetical protein
MHEAENNVVYIEFGNQYARENETLDELADLEAKWETIDRIIKRFLTLAGNETSLKRLDNIDRLA